MCNIIGKIYYSGKIRKGCYEKEIENKSEFFKIKNIFVKIILIIVGLDDEVEEIF